MPKTELEKSADAKRKRNRPLKIILTGTVFGKWTVGEPNTKEDRVTNRRKVFYKCTCSCGTVKEVSQAHLVGGRSTQCIECWRNSPTCSKGHVIATCGRNTSGGCRMCAKEHHLIRTYGITFAEYEALYNLQKGKCAICEKPLVLIRHATEASQRFKTTGRAEVDHEHVLKSQKVKPEKKSTVRGLLCGGKYAGCNRRLGKIDNVPWLTAALSYVANPPARQLFGKTK